MSITSLTLVAKDQNGSEVPFGFNPVLSKAGRTTKFVAPLATITDAAEGSGSAKDLRAMFKAQGVKGRALTEKVNTAVRQSKTVRQARLQLFLSTAAENGFVPDHIAANAKGTEFNIKLVSAKEKEKSESVKLRAAKSEADALAKESQALKEQLAKMQALLVAAGISADASE